MELLPSLETKNFSLKYTFESAQPVSFYADFSGEEITFPFGRSIVSMGFKGDSHKGVFRIASVRGETKFGIAEAKKLFRLKDNMPEIYRMISSDKFIEEAISRYHGMRLTLDDPWVTTLSFIVSQFNNIKRIRLIIKKLIERFGSEIVYDGRIIGKSFPEPQTLASASIEDIWKCGAGFRSKYIKASADYCSNNIDLHKLEGKRYEDLKESLLEMSGVGDKVADCIALMGYGKLEAFPIDTWIKRTVENIYFNKKKTIKEIHEFAKERWNGLAGYAQQYIYWHGMHYLR
ncbi:MAG: DNA-3-methyladenine glycosylase family protein [Candidatus Micrarchaeia archaeon]